MPYKQGSGGCDNCRCNRTKKRLRPLRGVGSGDETKVSMGRFSIYGCSTTIHNSVYTGKGHSCSCFYRTLQNRIEEAVSAARKLWNQQQQQKHQQQQQQQQHPSLHKAVSEAPTRTLADLEARYREEKRVALIAAKKVSSILPCRVLGNIWEWFGGHIM